MIFRGINVNFINALSILLILQLIFILISGDRLNSEELNNKVITDKNKTPSKNLSFTEIWGELPKNLGGHGVMFGDIDNDHWIDLYITLIKNIGTEPDLFLKNHSMGQYVEEAAKRGIDDSNDGGSHGAAWADLDNDGDLDLVNAASIPPGFGYDETGLGAQNDIYENIGGMFKNVTPNSMVMHRERTRAIITLDWDNDGDLDIFAVNGSNNDKPEVYENQGNFNFTEITTGNLANADGHQGATDTDYDGDNDVDIIAGNRNGNMMIINNDGTGNYSVIEPSSIGISHQAKDGITTADVNNDKHLDLLLTSDNSGFLYLSDGKGAFIYSQEFKDTDGYMGGFADLDNDSDLDLLFAGDDIVYLNDGKGKFSAGPILPASTIDPRGIAFADIDNDGDLDFAVAAKRSGNIIFRNNYNSGNWLKVKLITKRGQIGAFGAMVYIYSAGTNNLLGMRESKSNYGYLSQDDQTLHFGLGTTEAVDLVVKFLDGTTIKKTGVDPNNIIIVDARKYE